MSSKRLAIIGTVVLACQGDVWRASQRASLAIERLCPDVVISGGAPGCDDLAENCARALGYREENGTLIIHRPRVRRWGGEGGYRWRDEIIAADCTHLLRMACRQSRTYGSGWTADRAEQLGAVVVRYVVCREAQTVVTTG